MLVFYVKVIKEAEKPASYFFALISVLLLIPVILSTCLYVFRATFLFGLSEKT